MSSLIVHVKKINSSKKEKVGRMDFLICSFFVPLKFKIEYLSEVFQLHFKFHK